jgi:hypothetical protein
MREGKGIKYPMVSERRKSAQDRIGGSDGKIEKALRRRTLEVGSLLRQVGVMVRWRLPVKPTTEIERFERLLSNLHLFCLTTFISP